MEERVLSGWRGRLCLAPRKPDAEPVAPRQARMRPDEFTSLVQVATVNLIRARNLSLPFARQAAEGLIGDGLDPVGGDETIIEVEKRARRNRVEDRCVVPSGCMKHGDVSFIDRSGVKCDFADKAKNGFVLFRQRRAQDRAPRSTPAPRLCKDEPQPRHEPSCKTRND